MKTNREFELTREMISTIKEGSERKPRRVIREAEEEKGEKEEAIAITDDPKFGENVLQNQIDNFRKSVNAGAKFGKANESDPESNPLVFYPDTGNLVFGGSIPNISGLRFQFSLNDVTNAPYIFVDGLALTEDVITTLNKLRGYFLNWKDEWEGATDLLDKLKKDREKDSEA